jgi:hypothetical protein
MPGHSIDATPPRHLPPLRSITLWMATCLVLVVVAQMVIARTSFRPDSYHSGIIALAGFVILAFYSPRKRSLWASARLLRLTASLPTSSARRILTLDRLATWRFGHVSLGMLFLLPLWWHLQAGIGAGAVEIVLGVLVGLLELSGVAGASIQEILPHAMQMAPDHEVRLQDVESALGEIYNVAEEAILGHSETLVKAYLERIRPILRGASPRLLLMRATLTASDPSAAQCARLRARPAELGAETELYGELVNLAARKIRLEQNRLNLKVGVTWLRVHIAIALLTALVIMFHVIGILYLNGL